ncbi:MAG: hypothetical protein GY898_16230 [Proteobacteria bacterium]|nr:hypothetical protein [Pseudomonadota bacterium]
MARSGPARSRATTPHGVDNLWAADASVFPTTITINPQWLVSALGWTAGEAIAAHLER